MPRPKPHEELVPAHYRLTRAQIRKVKSLGGAAWLREVISKARPARHGRDSVEYLRNLRKRNEEIAASTKTVRELAEQYKLSTRQIYAIKRVY